MRINRILLAIATVSIIVFASCGTGAAVQQTESVTYSSRVGYVNSGEIVTTPMIVDIRVDFEKKVTATSEKRKLGNAVTVDDLKSEANAKAMKANKIDKVVEPMYEVVKEDGECQVTVTGYAGYYTNARSVYEEINKMKDIEMEDIKKYLMLKENGMIQMINAWSSEEFNVIVKEK